MHRINFSRRTIYYYRIYYVSIFRRQKSYLHPMFFRPLSLEQDISNVNFVESMRGRKFSNSLRVFCFLVQSSFYGTSDRKLRHIQFCYGESKCRKIEAVIPLRGKVGLSFWILSRYHFASISGFRNFHSAII